jgi:radical SAM protein with 4Fe4S-binding SPASM domain
MDWNNVNYIEPPWTFKIEMSKGCNLRCKFCPVYARPDLQDPAKREFMPPATLLVIVRSLREVKHNGRIELTMRGEPTLNPALVECVGIMRAEMPLVQIAMFTNGTQILKRPALAVELIDAGLNILNIDCYNNTYDRFDQLADQVAVGQRIEKKDFRQFSAYKRHPHGHKLRVINLVPDIGAAERLVAVRVLHNNAGNSDPVQLEQRWGIKPLAAPLAKKCVRPFREMVVAVNGDVLICCHDWGDELVLGNLLRQSAAEIWYGDLHRAVLRSLYAKDRSGAPCNKCDYKGGYRIGFLKDPQ